MAYPFKPKLVSRLNAQFVNETTSGALNLKKAGASEREGTLAETLRPQGLVTYQDFDVVRDFRWTLSKLRNDDLQEVPYIRLKEFKVVDSSIKRQISAYASIAGAAAIDGVGGQGIKKEGVLGSYDDIWPQDNPSGFTYKFPYFNKTGLELASEPWQALDSIGDAVKNIAGGAASIFSKKLGQVIEKTVDVAQQGTEFLLKAQYPSVGVTDRPKIFMSHADRSINISFTLYNTFTETDWAKNRDLVYILMSQNLFNKRDYITGVPPVFYSVYIPGQYFCYAANISNFKVENLGNQRVLNVKGQQIIVPDAYQVEITLSELVKPSKNQFEAMSTGEALNLVTVQTVGAGPIQAIGPNFGNNNAANTA